MGYSIKSFRSFINDFVLKHVCCIIVNMKSFLKSFVMCAFLLFLAGSAFANEITDDLLDIAKNYYNEGNKSKTLEYVNQILEIEEGNLAAIELKIKLDAPKCNKVFPDIYRPLVFDVPFVKTNDFNIDSAYEQGLSAYKNKDYLKAESYFNQAINSGGEPNFRIYNTLGLVYWAQRKFDEAKQSFLRSNDINKMFTLSLDNLSQIYKQTGDLSNCKQTLLKSISLNPKDFCAHILLGDYYRFTNDFEGALANYREVVSLNPKYFNAYLKIATVRTESMDFAGSNATLNYYLKLNPSDDYAYLLMARNYLYMNDYEKAKESIYKAILAVNSYEYRAEFGKIYYYSGDMKSALDMFLQSVNKKTSAEVYNYIGMCYYHLHEFNKAISYLNKAINSDDYRIIYHYNLAKVYEALKDDISYERCMNAIRDYALETYQDYIDKAGILLDSDSKNAAINVLNEGIVKFPLVKELYLEKLKIYDLTEDVEGAQTVKNDMERVFK